MDKLQVLVASMHQKDFSKAKSMNLSSDAIIANQSDHYAFEEINYPFGTVKMITTAQRGVGKNRNIALDMADGDIILLADDDIKYVDSYAALILGEFEKLPEADVIVFNIMTHGESTDRRHNTETRRVRLYNALNYGAVRMAVRREKLERAGIHFNLNFGGGTLYSAGEDTIFMYEMMKKGLKVFTSPIVIAEVDQTSSTWFKGYNNKYFYDKGALFRHIFGKLAYIFAMQDFIRHRDEYRKSKLPEKKAFAEIWQGIKGYKFSIPYKEKNNATTNRN